MAVPPSLSGALHQQCYLTAHQGIFKQEGDRRPTRNRALKDTHSVKISIFLQLCQCQFVCLSTHGTKETTSSHLRVMQGLPYGTCSGMSALKSTFNLANHLNSLEHWWSDQERSQKNSCHPLTEFFLSVQHLYFSNKERERKQGLKTLKVMKLCKGHSKTQITLSQWEMRLEPSVFKLFVPFISPIFSYSS